MPSLTVDDLHRLNRLLAEGMEREGEARAAWLQSLAADDRHLQAVLVDLLNRSEQQTLAGLTHPPTHVARVAADALAAMRREQPGDRLGPWRLERLLAEGGMGAVWIAERADGVMKRRAALKLPRAEWVDRGLVERIGRERAILARLQHPAIAVLYDAGLTAEGRPYLALEYVDGVPIDAWCRGRALDEVLRLYVQVVRSVAYAHGQLVIHRDLKPANVLVTGDGQPKLLDFGISKLIEGEAASTEATALTRLAGRPLTLAYAAPEQLLGLPIGVAADVYALGVMLFELVSGVRLYRAGSARELEQEILRGDLRRPSDCAADRARARALRGDLDAIVATALKRTPAERYQSTAALADDLEAYLAGQPVKARPDSRRYRLAKFVARHRLPVAAGVAVVLALGIGLGVALWQAGAARQQAARATALNTFVLGLIRTADPNASSATKAADVAMLRSIEERIDHDFSGSPDQLLQLRVTIGDAYKNRGEMMAARRVFQRAVDEAAPRLPANDLTLLTAEVRAADFHLIVSTQAAAQLDRAIEALRPVAARDSAAAELLIDALVNRNELQFNYGVPAYLPPERRFDSIDEAHRLALRHFGAGSRQELRVMPHYEPLVAVRKPEEASGLIASALEAARQRGGDVIASVEYMMLQALHASQACERGQLLDGESVLRDLIDRVRAAHGPSSVLLESLLGLLDDCNEDAGRSGAFDAYEIAAAREQPPSTNLMRRASAAFDAAGGRRDYRTAERFFQIALDNARAIPEPALRDRLTFGLRSGQICLMAQRGDGAEAVPLAMPLKAQLDATFERLGRITPDDGVFWTCLSHAQRLSNNAAAALQTAQTFLHRCRLTMKTAPALFCAQRALSSIALAQLELGQIDPARESVEQRLALSNRYQGDPNFALAYGRVLLATGQVAESIEVLRKLYGNWLSEHPESPYTAEALYWFGKAYLAGGDQRGRWMVPQARAALAKSPVALHRSLAKVP
jgi:tetratricopeptide (TPR) repeat protein/tRNA A-37 threonylcarbamoyl transferase component Bud32